MNKIYETTLVKPIFFKGVGLHSGLSSEIKIFPADPNSGINFKRVDVKKNNIIHANYNKVTSAKLCTTLENEYGVKVSTVEHLLAAFYICGIDNVLVEINSEEVPIMDGSAKEFLKILRNTEITTLSEKRKYLKISKKFELVDGRRKISIEPNNNSLEVDFQLDYENKLIGKQKNVVDFQKDDLKDVSVSRTFCLFEDIERIKKAGLAKGGSLDNAIVVKENKILNDGGLRNQKEFVNHKILDCIGDLYTCGYRMLGNVKCSQGGHYLTNELLRKVFDNQENFAVLEIKEKVLPLRYFQKNLLKSIA